MIYSKKGEPPHFGEWLRRLRVGKDLPLRAVAAAADMDVALLSKIELGQRLPTEEQTAKVAKFFGLSETETHARRMAEKFLQENHDNPKAAREAISILAEDAGIYSSEKKSGKTGR
jgi:HTH-type transcriptional regulator, competence development regulator